MMGKSQKVSKGRPIGFVPDYRNVVETVGESEVFASPTRIDSEDSCAPNPKSTRVNGVKTKGFDVPLQFFSLSNLSFSERKELESRLRGDLERLRTFQRRFHASHLAGGTRPVAKKEEHALLQKNPKLDRVNSSKPAKPAHAPVQPPPPANKPQLSNNHVMLMKQCETLLKRLMAHQYAWVFNTPVDVVKLNIPDYFQVIKQPMDLGTVKEKLSSGSYTTPLGFASDVRLTFSNAMTYNPPSNDVHVMADVMAKFFEARWKSIEKKIGMVEQPAAKREVPADKKEAKTGEAKGVLPKKRKAEPPQAQREVETVRESPKKRKMTDEQKIGLSRRLESIVGELPEHIIEFLRRHISNESQSGDDEIEIDIDSLGDETLFELERLLNEFMREKEKEAMDQAKNENYEVLNESGLSNSSMHGGKGHEPAEEEVDIGGNEPPVSRYSPVVIEKETVPRNSKCDTSSSSSTSASTSHDSDSSSSSGSGSDAKASSPLHENKERPSGPASDREKKLSMGSKQPDADDPLNLANSTDMDSQMDGDNGSADRPVSPGKQYRAALLRGRFADTILKAREKTLDQGAKKDPEKLRREREELERLRREEKARLQAEAKAAEEARKRAEAEEAKCRRAQEREAARQALQQMEKTVEIDEGNLFMRDLEMLRTAPEHIASSVGETSPMDTQEGIGTGFRPGTNPLEQLGLFMKVDDDDEDEPEPDTIRVNDVEEGEID
ncbi:Transcription factor GTE8 [Rhynchospora pubera]|uniref:Transcription factor GTE8 n=1 Tax=Rhynchospora pubera TaxID=906938 RepID=A0AAV8F4P5_9POAL|nr:Transcription factor GTE8 [Rhynchospora pubera]